MLGVVAALLHPGPFDDLDCFFNIIRLIISNWNSPYGVMCP